MFEEFEKAEELENLELERSTYRSLKRDLIGIEEENVSEIILQKCSGRGNWFEIADHSALIYYYYVIQVLKKKGVRFEADYDSFFEQYKIGRIRVRGVDAVRIRIKRAMVYGREYVTTGRLVFVLNKPLTKEKLKILERREAKRRLNLNKTVEIEHSDPLFYRNLAELSKWLHQICSSRLDKLTSQTNGARIVTLVDGIMTKYLHSTDVPKDKLKAREDDWTEIRRQVYQLKYEIQNIDAIRMWPPEVCLKVFEQNNELLKLANSNLAKILMEKKKKK